jgi:hypothetical protein
VPPCPTGFGADPDRPESLSVLKTGHKAHDPSGN